MSVRLVRITISNEVKAQITAVVAEKLEVAVAVVALAAALRGVKTVTLSVPLLTVIAAALKTALVTTLKEAVP